MNEQVDHVSLEDVIREHFIPVMSEEIGKRVDLLCSPAFERIGGDYVAWLCVRDEPTIGASIQIPAWWLDKSPNNAEVIAMLDRQLRCAAKSMRAAVRQSA